MGFLPAELAVYFADVRQALEKAEEEVLQRLASSENYKTRVEELQDVVDDKCEEIKRLDDTNKQLHIDLEKTESKIDKARLEARNLEETVEKLEAKLKRSGRSLSPEAKAIRRRLPSPVDERGRLTDVGAGEERQPSESSERSRSQSAGQQSRSPAPAVKEEKRERSRSATRASRHDGNTKDRGGGERVTALAVPADRVTPRKSRSRPRGDGRSTVALQSRTAVSKETKELVRAPAAARSMPGGLGMPGLGPSGPGGEPLCFLFIIGRCTQGDACASRHPGKEDCTQILTRMQRTGCRYGADCKRKDCVFKHPEERDRKMKEA